MQKSCLFLFELTSGAYLLSTGVGEVTAALVAALDVESRQRSLCGLEKLFDLKAALQVYRIRLADIVAQMTLDTEHRIEIDQGKFAIGTECACGADTVAYLTIGALLINKFLRSETHLFFRKHLILPRLFCAFQCRKKYLALVGQLFFLDLADDSTVYLKSLLLIGIHCLIKYFFLLDRTLE